MSECYTSGLISQLIAKTYLHITILTLSYLVLLATHSSPEAAEKDLSFC